MIGLRPLASAPLASQPAGAAASTYLGSNPVVGYQQRDYNRPVIAAPKLGGLFTPADPVYIFTGARIQPEAAYLRDRADPRLPSFLIQQAPTAYLSPPPLPQVQDRPYNRPVVGPVRLGGIFTPPDPVYAFTGPTLQPVAPYRRDYPTQVIFGPWVMQQPVGQVFPTPLATYQDRPYNRPTIPSIALGGIFTPPDPVYVFQGLGIQPIAAYRRDYPGPQMAPPGVQGPPPDYILPSVLARYQDREYNRPVIPPVRLGGIFTPADPVYNFTGPTIQPIGAYVRTFPIQLPFGPWVAPPLPPFNGIPIFVSYQQRDYNRPSIPLVNIANIIVPPVQPYLFTTPRIQPIAAYRRDYPTQSPVGPRLTITGPPAPVTLTPDDEFYEYVPKRTWVETLRGRSWKEIIPKRRWSTTYQEIPTVSIGPKDPTEVVVVSIDFTQELAGEIIITRVCVATTISGTDASPSAILSGTATNAGGIVMQAVIGGVIGCTYEIKATITTSGGRTLVGATVLPIVVE
jgi:hypothetical protein